MALRMLQRSSAAARARKQRLRSEDSSPEEEAPRAESSGSTVELLPGQLNRPKVTIAVESTIEEESKGEQKPQTPPPPPLPTSDPLPVNERIDTSSSASRERKDNEKETSPGKKEERVVVEEVPSPAADSLVSEDDEELPPETCPRTRAVLFCLPSRHQKAVREMLRYISFLIIFTVIVLGRNAGSTRFLLADMASENFSPQEDYVRTTFQEITSVDAMWSFLSTDFVEALNTNRLSDSGERLAYSSNSSDTEALKLYYQHNVIAGSVRLTQKRISKVACDVKLNLGSYYESWAETALARTSFNSDQCAEVDFLSIRESKTTYGSSSAFVWQQDPDYDVNRYLVYPNTLYGSGGFMVDLPLPPFGGMTAETLSNTTTATLLALRDANWIDFQTAALFVDFTIFNPSSSYFVTVRLFFEFLRTGGIVPRASYRVHRFFVYETAVDFVFLALFIVLYLAVLGYTYEMLRKLIKLRGNFCENNWNIVELIMMALFYTVLVMRIIADVSAVRLRDKLRDFSSDSCYVNFQPLAYTLNQDLNVAAFVAVLSWGKVFRYLAVSPRMSQLNRTLARAAQQILVFLCMFVLCFFGFAFGFFVAFGANVRGFRSLADSMFSLFGFLLGDFDLVALQESNWLLGPSLFVLYIFVVVFVLLSMFIAILNDAYGKIQEEVENQKEDPFAAELQDYFHGVASKLKSFFGRGGDDKGALYAVGDDNGSGIPHSQSLIEQGEELAEKIQRADTNDDMRVNVEELADAIDGENAGLLLGVHGSGHTRKESVAASVMARFDKDHDGELNAEEIDQVAQEIRARARDQEMRERLETLETKLDRLMLVLTAGAAGGSKRKIV